MTILFAASSSFFTSLKAVLILFSSLREKSFNEVFPFFSAFSKIFLTSSRSPVKCCLILPLLSNTLYPSKAFLIAGGKVIFPSVFAISLFKAEISFSVSADNVTLFTLSSF